MHTPTQAPANGGPSLSNVLRGVLRRDFVTLCLSIVLADMIWSLLSPTFSIYATDMGASLSLVGLLTGLTGLTQFLTSIPLGLQSDRRGRKTIIVFGFLIFAVAMLVFAAATSPWMLAPGRVLFGLATVATFSIATAYVGDVIKPHERGIAFGLYTSSMGLGSTLGPLLGAAIQPRFGIAGGYLAGVLIALAGAALATWGLSDTRKLRPDGLPHHAGPALGTMVRVLRDPNLVAACVATLAANSSFNGLIANIFPIYASERGASQAEINTMFSARALMSTLSRMPAGILSSRFSRWLFIIGALAAMAVAAFAMPKSESLAGLVVLLVIEGLAFGTFLTVGNSFVAEHTTSEIRGAAIGAYSTAGSLGGMLSPLLLGIIADAWGLPTAFGVSAAFTSLGVGVIGLLYVRQRSRGAL